MNRHRLLALPALALALVLAGCGGYDDTVVTPPPAEPSTSAAPAPACSDDGNALRSYEPNASALDGPTIDKIRERGRLIAGVAADTNLLGSRNPENNEIEGFDIDMAEAIAETIFGDHPIKPEQQLHWFQMRRALFRLHRLAVPMREAISSLMRREHGTIGEDIYPYFQDVYDHILRVTESTDALRDLVATIVETNLSLRDYRQNQVMKKVTSWAAIIAVPTLVTGWYGMNVPYPGSGETWGVYTSSGVAVVCSVSLYTLLRRKKWL